MVAMIIGGIPLIVSFTGLSTVSPYVDPPNKSVKQILRSHFIDEEPAPRSMEIACPVFHSESEAGPWPKLPPV